MQVGTPSQELKERNKNIYKDFTSKKISGVQMVKKYGISTQRIYAIVASYKKKYL